MEVTIEITDHCPNSCEYCSTNAGKDKSHMMNAAQVDIFLREAAAKEKIDRINISGGEPLANPEFYSILQLCYSFTPNVWVYTNAIRQLIYNSDVIPEIKVEANVCLVPGRHVYIPQHADKVHLLQLVPQGRAKDMKPANFHVSGNILGEHKCAECSHVLLQADGKIVDAPCKKEYGCALL